MASGLGCGSLGFARFRGHDMFADDEAYGLIGAVATA